MFQNPWGFRTHEPGHKACVLLSPTHAQDSIWPRKGSWDVMLGHRSLHRWCYTCPGQALWRPGPCIPPAALCPGYWVLRTSTRSLGDMLVTSPQQPCNRSCWPIFQVKKQLKGGPGTCPKPHSSEQSREVRTWPAWGRGLFSDLLLFLAAPGTAALSLSTVELPKVIPGPSQTLPSTVGTAFITHLGSELHQRAGPRVFPAHSPHHVQPRTWHTAGPDKGRRGE